MLNMHSIVTLRSWSILISHHVVIFLYIYCEFNRLVEITLITSSSLDTSLAGLNVTQPRYLEKTAILLLLLFQQITKKWYKRIQIKQTTLHNNKRTIELLQGCVDYITILASQMLLIYQNNTLTRFL